MGVEGLVEVRLKSPSMFLVVKETLERIGIANEATKTLNQSCHILHKRGRYYIPHFKEMLQLDGKSAPLSEEDLARRNTIIGRLVAWNLIDVVDENRIKNPPADQRLIRVVPFKQKSEWRLVPKYEVGRKTRPSEGSRKEPY